jgi:hypothetical protein
MRRLLVLLAVAGAAAWLAAPALTDGPFVPRAIEFEQPVPRGALEPAPAPDAGWRSAVIRAPKRFDLVGLHWHGAAHAEPRIRVRDATDGRWSAWTAMAGDHAGGRGAEPVWAGGADAYQLRLQRIPRGLRARFVNATGTATASDRVLTALRRGAQRTFAALAGTPAHAQDPAPRPPGAPQIVPREAWGAEQCGTPRADPTYGSVQAAFVHHTVNANDYGPQDSAAIVLAICRYHRNSNGWRDIGYNFLVDRFGTIFEGRAGGIEEPVVGAQAEGYNTVSTGVANIGTFSGVAQTAAALEATSRLIAWKLSLHGSPVVGQVSVLSGGGPSNRYRAGTRVTFERIAGHRDGDRTTCPGDALFAQLPQIRRRAEELAPQFAPPAPAATLTLAAADATLAFPEAARLSGRAAAPDGTPLPGAPIAIQVASPAGFVTLARAVTAADGTWAAQLPTQYTRTLRAVVRPPAGPLAASPKLTVEVAPRIGVTAPRRVVARRPFRVRGSIRPLRAGLVLVIARKGSDGAFHTVARVPLKAVRGRFGVTLRLRRPALHRLRIFSRGDARNRAGRSRDVVLRAVRPR